MSLYMLGDTVAYDQCTDQSIILQRGVKSLKKVFEGKVGTSGNKTEASS